MSNLLYLGIALAISVVGCLAIWLRNRRPRSMDAQIREFARGLEAIAPEQQPVRPAPAPTRARR